MKRFSDKHQAFSLMERAVGSLATPVLLILLTGCGHDGPQHPPQTTSDPRPTPTADSTTGSARRDSSVEPAVLPRSYTSDTDAQADILVMDTIKNPRFFLTRAAGRVPASYHLVGTNLEPATYTGAVPESWARAEADASAGNYEEVTSRRLPDQVPYVSSYRGIKPDQSRPGLATEHGSVVIETLLIHNPTIRVVYADDYTRTSDDCSAYAGGESAIDERMARYAQSYIDVLRRHQIRLISRSMSRPSKGTAEYILRLCDGISFETVAYYQIQEQKLLDRIAAEANVLILNANDNDPQETSFYIDGGRRDNPVYKNRSASPLYIGYVNRPDLVFFPEGLTARPQFVPGNQWNELAPADVFIDGNMDEEIYIRAAGEFDSTGPSGDLGLADFAQEVTKRNLVWWQHDSFRYVMGQVAWAPLDRGAVGLIDISGMATSWATPLAAGLALAQARDKGLDLKNPAHRSKLKELMQRKIFDPIANNQFLR